MATLLTTAASVSCAAQERADPPGATTSPPRSSPRSPSAASSGTGGAPASTGTPAEADPAGPRVVGTVVRFTSSRTSVDVTIGEDSPATRDFLSMLPTMLSVEDLSRREKISYLPRELEHAGTPGSDPEDGDLIYFTPWGNLGFYYDATGIDYADDTLHLGTYDASREQLELLEDDAVEVTVAEVTVMP